VDCHYSNGSGKWWLFTNFGELRIYFKLDTDLTLLNHQLYYSKQAIILTIFRMNNNDE